MTVLRLAAAAVAAAFLPAAALAAPAWTVDHAASRVGFASSFGGEAFQGAFARWSADIRFDPKDLAGSSVTATIDTASAASGDKDRDQAIPSADFLDAARYRSATFVARQFRDLGGGRYEAIGVLTMRGVAKPLTLPFTLAITGRTAKMTANVALNRLAFGVGQGQWRNVETIPAAVTVTIALTATRTP
ncbi:MAG TPA: YceI family protein [Caulobacteraceae bacterium]|nr:YceI family protein [Caulobacteraceae bacterium]